MVTKHHHELLSLSTQDSSQLTKRSLSLWSGIETFDPTADVKIVEFCYNLPQWAFRRGSKVQQRRLLVREGLEGILPAKLRLSPYRGEQAADWIHRYSRFREKWHARLAASKNKLLWEIYDRSKMLALFRPLENLSREAAHDINGNLMRCIAMSDFLEYVEHGELSVVRAFSPSSR